MYPLLQCKTWSQEGSLVPCYAIYVNVYNGIRDRLFDYEKTHLYQRVTTSWV